MRGHDPSGEAYATERRLGEESSGARTNPSWAQHLTAVRLAAPDRLRGGGQRGSATHGRERVHTNTQDAPWADDDDSKR